MEVFLPPSMKVNLTKTLFHAANDHSARVLDWMEHLAPEQGDLARDEPRAECDVSARLPSLGMKWSCRETLLSLGRSVVFLCRMPCSRRLVRL